jgi:hypothetical protein
MNRPIRGINQFDRFERVHLALAPNAKQILKHAPTRTRLELSLNQMIDVVTSGHGFKYL